MDASIYHHEQPAFLSMHASTHQRVSARDAIRMILLSWSGSIIRSQIVRILYRKATPNPGGVQ